MQTAEGSMGTSVPVQVIWNSAIELDPVVDSVTPPKKTTSGFFLQVHFYRQTYASEVNQDHSTRNEREIILVRRVLGSQVRRRHVAAAAGRGREMPATTP